MNFLFKPLLYLYSFFSFLQRKVFIKNISRDDLVLDVGSGDKPFWRADVIVDKYPKDNKQRISGSIIFDKRKLFIKADVEDLPFKDKAFDFVFCSHLLEHVENPTKALAEITRVGKRGYIEAPWAFLDSLEPLLSHLWFCELDGGTLVFERRRKERKSPPKNTEKLDKRFSVKFLLQSFLTRDFTFGFICFYWERNVNFRVKEADKEPYVYKCNKELTDRENFSKRLTFGFHKLFYAIFYMIVTSLFYQEKDVKESKILKQRKND